MAYKLGDIFIGQYPITQHFADRPEVYSSRYGLKGHNGIDWGCPSLTPILSTTDGKIIFIGLEELGTFDSGGFGRYVKILHNGFISLYGHLNDIAVKNNETVVAGQLIGHSNNTGFSDGPHLHFGIAPSDSAGNKTEKDNGFSGYIDPLDTTQCEWDIKNLQSPIVPGQTETEQKIPVLSTDFTNLVSQAGNYKVIASYLLNHGLNEYLTSHALPPIDFNNHPSDGVAGDRINVYLNDLLVTNTKLSEVIASRQDPGQIGKQMEQAVSSLSADQQKDITQGFWGTLKKYIFTQK